MAFLIFAISLIPGMFGGRLGELDAYVPVADRQAAGRRRRPSSEAWSGSRTSIARRSTAARREGKLVFVNFTGYACTNCHWMKANMFTRPEIAAALKNLCPGRTLYRRHGRGVAEERRLRRLAKFNTVAIPFYAILDADQKVIATFPQLTRNTKEFLAFLEAKPGSKT